MKKDSVRSVALHELGPGGTMILIYPMCPLAHSEARQMQILPRSYVQCALTIGILFHEVCLSPGVGGGGCEGCAQNCPWLPHGLWASAQSSLYHEAPLNPDPA